MKQAHNKATGDTSIGVNDPVWKWIWKKGNILPRIRMFLWKLMHNALPLAKIIHARISKGDPTCAVCGQGEEDLIHMLFLCPFARACCLMGRAFGFMNREPTVEPWYDFHFFNFSHF